MLSKGLLGSAALWATIAGQSLFGFLGDRLSRRPLQIAGFAAIRRCTWPRRPRWGSGSPALWPSRYAPSAQDFGPNAAIFVLPAELYSTRYRAISAAAGKLGAALAAMYFPALMADIGVPRLLQLLAVASAAGLLISYFS